MTDDPPWTAAWRETERAFARLVGAGATSGVPSAVEAQQKLADFARDYAGIAGAAWSQLQSGGAQLDALRDALVERYRQLFMPAGLPEADGTGPARAGDAVLRAQQASQRFATQAALIALDAGRRLEAALSASGAATPPITTLRELHALWIDCGEEAYAAAAHREEFAAAQAELLAALVELRGSANR